MCFKPVDHYLMVSVVPSYNTHDMSDWKYWDRELDLLENEIRRHCDSSTTISRGCTMACEFCGTDEDEAKGVFIKDGTLYEPYQCCVDAEEEWEKTTRVKIPDEVY